MKYFFRQVIIKEIRVNLNLRNIFMLKKAFLFSALISLVFLSGCNLPFYTKYKVKKYLISVQPIFDKVTADQTRLENAVNNKEMTTAEEKDEMTAIAAELGTSKKDLAGTVVPEEVATLNADLNTYIESISNLSNKMKTLFDFLVLAQGTMQNLETVAGKLPQNFDQKTLTQIKNDLQQSIADQEKVISELKAKEAGEEFANAKNLLLAMDEQYLSVLKNFILGIDNKDTKYFSTTDFTAKFNQMAKDFNTELSKVLDSLDIQNKDKNVRDQNNKVKKDISDLKTKYNI